MSSIPTRAARTLSSARLAAWLIVALLGFLVVSFVVPQRGIFPEEVVEDFLSAAPAAIAWLLRTLALDHVFTSPLFYAAAFLLTLNLLFCTVRRILVRMRRAASPSVRAIPSHALRVDIADAAAAGEFLTSLGARADRVGAGEARYYLRRGDVGFAGSVVLHAGLVLVLVSGVLSSLTTFRGDMVFTEGQTHRDTPSDYLAIAQTPAVGEGFGDFAIVLDSMEFTYVEGSVIDAVARMRVIDAQGERVDDARVNYPLRVAGKSFLLQEAGHSVWLTVTDAAGTTVLDSFVNLLSVTDLGYRDSYALPDGILQIVSRPDSASDASRPVENGLDLVSPTVGIAFGDVAGAGDLVWVRPGDAAVALGGYTVAVNEVRIWNSFLVRADGGRYPVYVAFFLIILGTLARFLDVDRWLRAVIIDESGGWVLYVWGAERYRSGVLPREGRRLIAALDAGGDAGTPPRGGSPTHEHTSSESDGDFR